MNYEQKYLKYKAKYIKLKNEYAFSQSGSGPEFIKAIKNGDINKVKNKLTIPHGFRNKHTSDPNQVDKSPGPDQGKSSLILAIERLNVDMINLLLDNKADVNIFSSYELSPLFKLHDHLFENYKTKNIPYNLKQVFEKIVKKTNILNLTNIHALIFLKYGINSSKFINYNYIYSTLQTRVDERLKIMNSKLKMNSVEESKNAEYVDAELKKIEMQLQMQNKNPLNNMKNSSNKSPILINGNKYGI
jgi:hypothetical protein